jgi:peptide/nickel transport system permease protein
MTLSIPAVARRAAFAPVVLLVVTALTYATPRVLRPDLYSPDDGLAEGVLADLERVFLHFDFGRACDWPGCPRIVPMWARRAAWDLWLLAGGLAIGVGGGVLAGLWCAQRPRSMAARTLEGAAMVLYCAPVYVVGLLLLKLFNPTFGLLPLPGLFDADPRWVSPFTAPWDWLRTLLVPWLILAAPLGAMCLRLTLTNTLEALGEDYVRTAVGKGLSPGRVIRRHAAPASFVPTVSFVGISVPLIVTNIVLIEQVFSVPGFFQYTWKALGHVEPPGSPDFPMLQALTVWSTAFIVVLGVLTDALLPWLDPRIRNAP